MSVGHDRSCVENSDHFILRNHDDVAVVEFAFEHRHNPFSMERMFELRRILEFLDTAHEVRAIVLFGGEGRSFSVGGDFKEVSQFSGGSEVDAWIDCITDLYLGLLGISKPLLCAVEGYAIGIGLQICLCCDYRIGSEMCALKMPEFQVGIACVFGEFMLEAVVGRSIMQAMLFSCSEWTGARALSDGLLHELAAPGELALVAVSRARQMASYPALPVRITKARMNRHYTEGMREVRFAAKDAHRQAFAAGAPQPNMRRVLGH